MITLEKFTKIIENIQKHQKNNEYLTDLLVCKDSTGWISFGDSLVDDLLYMLKTDLNDEYDYIAWWMWDFLYDDDEKHVYDSIDDTELSIEYNLTELKDLYYYIIGDLDKVKKRVIKTKDLDDKILPSDTIDTVSLEELKQILKGDNNDLYDKLCKI